MKIATLVTSLLAVVPGARCFMVRPTGHSTRTFFTPCTSGLKATEMSDQLEETFYEALECCSKKFVDVDKFDRLATELEQVEGAQFEEGELGEKEIQDRLDVAEILRLKIELHLRMDYLEKANLFAADVRTRHNADERKKLKEALLENREKSPDGSDLGLW